MVLLDTHALLWWTLDPGRLSVAARNACVRMPKEGALLSAISIWEIGIKQKRNKLSIGTTLEDYVQRLSGLDYLEICPVDVQVWVKNVNLPWDHRDPADRTIVATAELRGVPILTKDRAIQDYYPDVVW